MAIEQELLTPFTWGAGGRRKTPDEIERDKKLAALLMERGGDYSPIQHWTQGGARVMSALAGVVRENRASKAALDNAGASAANIAAMLAGMNQQQPSGPSVIPAPQMPKQGPQPSPFPVESGSVKPQQPFQPPMQTEASPFVKPEGSVAPEQSFTQQTAAELPQNVMELTPQDINRLRKLVLTEAVHGLPDDVYNQQVGGIVDTALNRLRSGQWGKDLPSVLNAPYQFSDINGPVSWKSGRKGVDEIPDSWLNTPNGKRVAAALDAHLAARANTPPVIGGHLNYANPYYSDASNLSWINKLDGPKLGAGKAVHWHGTAGNQKPVDANYFLRVAGAQNQPPEARPVSLNAQLPENAIPQEADVPQQQVAQAINPFSMSDVNEGNSALALRPQRQMQQPVLPQAAPPPPAQQSQPPQQRPQLDPRIIQTITNPYASKEERAIAMEMIKPHITPTQYQMTPQPNGMVLRKDPRSGRVEVVNPYNGQVVTDPQQIPQGLRNTKFGLNPVWGVNEKGDVVPMQMGDDGTMRQSQMPEGVTVSQKPLKFDGGTEWVLMDPITRQIINRIPKNVAEVQKQQEIGKGEGQAIVNQPKVDEQNRQAKRAANVVVQDIDRALDLVKTATLPTTGGVGSVVKSIPGTASHDVWNLVNTIKANAAFDKLQAMRTASPTGGALGNVSDKENALLQAAIGSLEQSQSKDQFVTNLNRVKELYLDIIHGPGNRPQPRATDIPPAPQGVDANVWKYMTPEERKLWQN